MAYPDQQPAMCRKAQRLARSLEPTPGLEAVGLTPRAVAWLDQHDAAVAEIAAAFGDPAALRAAHGPPWDEETMGQRPLWRGLLIGAALKLESRAKPPPTAEEQAGQLARGLLLGLPFLVGDLKRFSPEVLRMAAAAVAEEYRWLEEANREEDDPIPLAMGPDEAEQRLWAAAG